jgi:SH3-like domain-containing protein
MRLAPTPVAVQSDPRSDSRTLALLRPRALAALQRCEAGWCRIKADGVTGWVPEAAMWGVDNRLQCVPAPAR